VNYTDLSASIRAYTENDFPDSLRADGTFFSTEQQINLFIVQAEQRIFNNIQFPSLRKNVTGTVNMNSKYVACPLDFLAVYSLAVIDATGQYTFLINKDVNYIREAYPNPTATGLPKYYALFGPAVSGVVITPELTFILGPTSDASYVSELHYFYYPESITTAGTSWLGDNIDSVLLYGALVEAYTFMKSEVDIVTGIDAKYKEALNLAKRLGDGLERGDAYRNGQARVRVT
jgi:hypothetical protein